MVVVVVTGPPTGGFGATVEVSGALLDTIGALLDSMGALLETTALAETTALLDTTGTLLDNVGALDETTAELLPLGAATLLEVGPACPCTGPKALQSTLAAPMASASVSKPPPP